jgi:DNA-binding GntR family transcriptional regulator
MSVISPIAISSLADEAFHKLVEAITMGEFQPGERLSEAMLARQLGISRGPLREALGRLEGFLVVRKPRIGVSIIELSARDLGELFSVREALEGMACRLAAQSIGQGEIDLLHKVLASHEKNSKVLNATGYYQRTKDEDFHCQIMRCANNERLEQLLMQGLYFQLRMYRFQSSARAGRAVQAFEEHCAIVEALEQRSPEKAEAAMRLHIRNAYTSLTLTMTNKGEEQSAAGSSGVRRKLLLSPVDSW